MFGGNQGYGKGGGKGKGKGKGGKGKGKGKGKGIPTEGWEAYTGTQSVILDSNAYRIRDRESKGEPLKGWAQHTVKFYKRKPAHEWNAHIHRATGKEYFCKGEETDWILTLDDYELVGEQNLSKAKRVLLIHKAKERVQQILTAERQVEAPVDDTELQMRINCERLYTGLMKSQSDGERLYTPPFPDDQCDVDPGHLLRSLFPMVHVPEDRDDKEKSVFAVPEFNLPALTPKSKDPRKAKKQASGSGAGSQEGAQGEEHWRLLITFQNYVDDKMQEQFTNIALKSAINGALLPGNDVDKRYDVAYRRNPEGDGERVAYDKSTERDFRSFREGGHELNFQQGFSMEVKTLPIGKVLVPDTKIRAINTRTVLDLIGDWTTSANRRGDCPHREILKELNPKNRDDGGVAVITRYTLRPNEPYLGQTRANGTSYRVIDIMNTYPAEDGSGGRDWELLADSTHTHDGAEIIPGYTSIADYATQKHNIPSREIKRQHLLKVHDILTIPC
jgi:hypothetical protein